MVMSSLSEESRWLTFFRRPASRVRPSISMEFSAPPWKVCGSRRLSLGMITGSLGVRVPIFRVLFDARSLAVIPASP